MTETPDTTVDAPESDGAPAEAPPTGDDHPDNAADTDTAEAGEDADTSGDEIGDDLDTGDLDALVDDTDTDKDN